MMKMTKTRTIDEGKTMLCRQTDLAPALCDLLPRVSSGKAYTPEFYYDTYSALWQNRPRVYGFKLQWTQMEPNAVDRILAYRLGIRQVSTRRILIDWSHVGATQTLNVWVITP